MPAKLIKSTDPITVNAITVLLYGQPGSRKSSTAQTANAPLTLDFDGGIHRAFGRKDTVQFESWNDVLTFFAEGGANAYQTIVVDTLGRLLDMLSVAVINESTKHGNRMGGLSLPGFGVLKSRFAFWIGALRQGGKDVVLICHEKADKNGDESYMRPDIVGGSYGETMKFADLIGYAHFFNGQRVLDFAPTDLWMAKGPAQWKPLMLPDFAAEPHFLANLITEAKKTMGQLSNDSLEMAKTVEVWKGAILSSTTAEDFTKAVTDPVLAALPKVAKAQVWDLMLTEAKAKGLAWDKKAKAFVGKEGVAA
jgi:hypothetical protein